MRPTSSVFNVIDESRADAVITRDGVSVISARQPSTNGKHLGLVQFCALEPRSLSGFPGSRLLSGTTFAEHVLRVIALRSRKQMGGIDALPIIASVKDARLVVRDVAINQEECDPMGVGGVLFADAKLAVTTRSETCRPFPAFIRSRLADLLPKRIDLSWGNIYAHRVLLTLGAMPGVVTAMPRLSVLLPQLYQMGAT